MLSNEAYDILISSVNDVLASRYIAVIAFTLCIYDWFILLADEVELLGRSRWSLGKGLYYFARIATPFGLAAALYHLIPELRDHLSRKFCIAFTFALPLVEVSSLISSYWLLMLRLVALYKSKPIVVYLLYTILILSWSFTTISLVQAQVFFAGVVQYSTLLGICATTLRAPTLSRVFYGPFFFELTLLTLTIYHAWNEHRSQREITRVPLLRVLYRDGVLFSVIMMGVRIWNILIWALQPLTRTYLGIYLMWAIITVLSSRIYLNMVQLAQMDTRGREPNVNFYEYSDGCSTYSHALTVEYDGLPSRRQSVNAPNPRHSSGHRNIQIFTSTVTMTTSDGSYKVIGGRQFPCIIGNNLPPKEVVEETKKVDFDEYQMDTIPRKPSNDKRQSSIQFLQSNHLRRSSSVSEHEGVNRASLDITRTQPQPAALQYVRTQQADENSGKLSPLPPTPPPKPLRTQSDTLSRTSVSRPSQIVSSRHRSNTQPISPPGSEINFYSTYFSDDYFVTADDGRPLSLRMEERRSPSALHLNERKASHRKITFGGTHSRLPLPSTVPEMESVVSRPSRLESLAASGGLPARAAPDRLIPPPRLQVDNLPRPGARHQSPSSPYTTTPATASTNAQSPVSTVNVATPSSPIQEEFRVFTATKATIGTAITRLNPLVASSKWTLPFRKLGPEVSTVAAVDLGSEGEYGKRRKKSHLFSGVYVANPTRRRRNTEPSTQTVGMSFLP